MSYGNLTESEMRIVLEARAQSRVEADEWERFSQRLKATNPVNENAYVNEFHGRSFQIESEELAKQTYRANG
jgi:hypothetical protein